MRIIAQRVTRASVTVSGEVISQVDRGIMALVGVFNSDTMAIAENMASKLAKLRIFNDDEGKGWEKNVMDFGGSVLCVSQFTLCANMKKGAKPDFHDAMQSEDSRKVFDHFAKTLRLIMGDPERVKEGQFGAKMAVELVNDGPVTIVLDSPAPAPEKPRKPQKVASPKKGTKTGDNTTEEDGSLAEKCQENLACKDDSATDSKTS